MTDRHWPAATRHVWSSSNDLGIPDLLSNSIVLPTRTAMTSAQSGVGSLVNYQTCSPKPGSAIGFWTDDYRMEPLWSRPYESMIRLRNWEPAFLIEPDFSEYTESPLILSLWNLYRSRWIARYWQENGISVLPNLQWNHDTVLHVGMGIPKGSAVACEARPRFKDPGLFLEGLSEAVLQIRPSRVLLYGQYDGPLPSGPEYISLQAWSPRKRINAERSTDLLRRTP